MYINSRKATQLKWLVHVSFFPTRYGRSYGKFHLKCAAFLPSRFLPALILSCKILSWNKLPMLISSLSPGAVNKERCKAHDWLIFDTSLTAVILTTWEQWIMTNASKYSKQFKGLSLPKSTMSLRSSSVRHLASEKHSSHQFCLDLRH